MARLSDAQVEAYGRDGHVTADWRLPAETIEAMRSALDKLVDANGHMTSDNMFCPHLRKAGTQGLEGDDAWLEFARIPEVLDMVEQLIGPDFLLWGSTVFGKPANVGKETPWHQDGEYWPICPLASCSAWIAIDDASSENGCLRVLPGTHRNRHILQHHRREGEDITLNEELCDPSVDYTTARDIVLEAGQISFHDVFLAHGSAPNRSGRRRAGYVCRYMPTTSVWDRRLGKALEERSGTVEFAKRDLYLVRGRDVSGQNTVVTDR
ncbi:MAG: phytanoyl-CoA dioxygenase family protein [Rhodospirillales bacterium]|nr:phytanoyl-CoA dioxygenase family protein [Rhodospirillales bacterium]MDE0712609.1 phytanoyl-CoA dioxygenase family protein [Rhodospirillales bacterium]